MLSVSLTQNVSLFQGAGYVYLSSLGSHAEAYERRAATLMAKFNTPVVDVGIPGLNLERPDLTAASTLSEMEAYRSAALRSGQPAPAVTGLTPREEVQALAAALARPPKPLRPRSPIVAP